MTDRYENMLNELTKVIADPGGITCDLESAVHGVKTLLAQASGRAADLRSDRHALIRTALEFGIVDTTASMLFWLHVRPSGCYAATSTCTVSRPSC